MSTRVPISSIVVEDRVRKDYGDLDELARSMQQVGQTTAVSLTENMRLVDGERRIRAAELLGWSEVEVHVVNVADLLLAERDANDLRKDFTVSEAHAIAREIERRVKAQVKAEESERQSANRRQVTTGSIEPVVDVDSGHRSRSTAAEAVGMSETSLWRAGQIIEAAEADHEAYGDLVEDMDAGKRSIHNAHEAMKSRQGRPTKSPRPDRHPIHKGTHHRNAARIISRLVDSLEGLALATEGMPDMSDLDPAQVAEWQDSADRSLRQLRRFMKEISNG